MTIFGMMRIKNEQRFIERTLRAALPVCERIFVFDDNSTDLTREIVRGLDEKITLIYSPFKGLDEARDKEYALDRIMASVSDWHLEGSLKSPFWCLAIDGDEVVEDGAAAKIRESIHQANMREIHALKLPILYVWDKENQIRVDGVYRTFARPSLFRLMNKAFRFQRTPWGRQIDGVNANFHCSSIPQELLRHAQTAPMCPARILHYGYFDARLRADKVAWYNRIDPNNPSEDRYRHCWQGDPGGPPADARLKHAGPMQFKDLSEIDWL